MSEPTRLDALRCADQDRELAATLLNNAYADGRLTFDEHSDRIARAYDAKTFGDLNALTADLVAFEAPAPAPAPLQQPSTPAYPAPTDTTAHPATTPTYGVPAVGAFTGGSALLSTYNPGRVSVVAGEVGVSAWLGEARLDFIGAVFERRETTLRISGGLGEVKIRVPEGVEVNVQGLNLVMAECKVRGVVPKVDGIRINLVGTVVMGEVNVVGPDMAQRKYERFIK